MQNITSRVLNLLSQQGRIVRGRPRGTWISTQYHWSPVETWLPAGLTGPSADEARAALAEQWLAAYGPAVPADLKWWTGWTMGQTKAALAALDTAPVDLDGTTGLVLARDAAPVEASAVGGAAARPRKEHQGWVSPPMVPRPARPMLSPVGKPGPTVWVTAHRGGWARAPRAVVRLEGVRRGAEGRSTGL